MITLLVTHSLAASSIHVGAGWSATQYPFLFDGMPIRHGLMVLATVRNGALDAGTSFTLVAPAAAEPSFALEASLRLDLVAPTPRWRPATGLELGMSTRSTSEVLEEQRPPGSYFADLGTPDPLWLDFTVTPARFAFGDYELSAARIGVGVSLLHPGQAGRWRAELVSVTRSF